MESAKCRHCLEHSQWLAMIYPRLELLQKLLAEDGSIWVSIDDHEGHYLKIVMDEVFGRGSFIASPVWQKRYSRENREAIGDVHEYLLDYSPSPERFKAQRNKLPLDIAILTTPKKQTRVSVGVGFR